MSASDFDDCSVEVVAGESSLEIGKSQAAPSFSSEDVINLIDADTHAYRAAAAADGSQWHVTRKSDKDFLVDFKYKKEADSYLKAQKDRDDFEVNQVWKPEPVENAIYNLKKSLRPFAKMKCEYWLTPKTCFRDEAVTDYKANRKGKRRPEHLAACKQYLVYEHDAKYWPRMEADDAVIIRATQLNEQGKKWVIVGCDKDLKQIAGTFYDPFTGKTYEISRAEARKNLWRQIASGDTTDNIITPKGLGPKTFDKAVKGLDFDAIPDFDLIVIMIDLYKSKEKPKDLIDAKTAFTRPETDAEYTARIAKWIKRTARLVYLLRSEGDIWTFPKNDGGIRW